MLNNSRLKENRTTRAIVTNMLLAAVSLFVNGFGVYLTIQANIGAGPWDVLNLGLSKTLGILYGTASVAISYAILGVDIALKEPIGIAMFIDAFVVGKAVDFFNKINVVPKCDSVPKGVVVMLIGLVIMAYTQYTYMSASLGCGPRDTLLVALAKRANKIPIGAVSIALLSLATFIGWLLGGPVGIGTLICAFATGPIMQMAFSSVKFDATHVHHQHLADSVKVFANRKVA
ncbi:YczE/YyaS/YitT family protein [Butyrivibrio sp. AE2032]|uniref:YczE/YyaS/YitT family protein n=1 Tax=Butyrivibrio sp. AE2032 TaxID=1458463 RepID=UPI000551A1D9|nr:membrane protein [Butyrivibrio sp. AE2032]